MTLPEVDAYRGNIYPKGTSDGDGSLIEGKIGATTNKEIWAGLWESEREQWRIWKEANNKEYKDWPGHKFYSKHWAGIDCMGLVLRSIKQADDELAYVSLPKLTLSVADKVVNSIGTENGVAYLGTTAFNKTNGDFDGKAYYRIAKEEQQANKIRRGDLALYGGHIAIVYSDGWGVSRYKKYLKTEYDIIHAYGGGATSTYNEKRGKAPIFARKVMVTGANIATPKGFGRIKLWE